jgi:hypothetical protein
MLEAARILGCFSAVLLVAAVAAWVKLARGPLLQRLDGRIGLNFAQAESASQLLVLALSLSVLAAILALAGSVSCRRWVAGLFSCYPQTRTSKELLWGSHAEGEEQSDT